MSAQMQTMIEEAERDLLHTYNRYPVVLERGDGVYLYDTDGKRYLDFMAGIAVFAFGYNNREYNEALKSQIDRLLHCSNYFYNEPAVRAAHRLKALSGMDRVFFTNSGAESNEGALKAAVKYACEKDDGKDHEIIAMEHSFHGRSCGALSVTGNAGYREPFESLLCDARFARLNDFASVQALANDRTCAVILEVVQGEGGLVPATKEFLEQVRALCDERDMLLIFDEVQCGMGRTGEMFAWQKFGVKPDIMTCAKALGCGVPVGAFLMTEKAARHSLAAGDHGTTYGGSPFACAAVNKVLDLFEEMNLVEHVRQITPYLEAQLDALVVKYKSIRERRGAGLMQGLVFDGPVGGIIADAMEHGLILINAGPDILRFVPPLVITEREIDEMISILEPAIEREEKKHRT